MRLKLLLLLLFFVCFYFILFFFSFLVFVLFCFFTTLASLICYQYCPTTTKESNDHLERFQDMKHILDKKILFINVLA